MNAFIGIAVLMTLLALTLLLWPLLRARKAKRLSPRAANLSIHRDQLRELDRDLDMGTIDAAQYESARTDLERRVLQDATSTPRAEEAPASSRTSHLAAIAIGIAVPIAAALMYLKLGQPDAVDAPRQAAVDPSAVTRQQFEHMTQQLAERLAENPDDPIGWLMLGRAYLALERAPEAVRALAEAERRRPNDAEVLVEYAEATALAQQRSLQGRPMALLERALARDPNHQKGLVLAGSGAFEAGDYRRAIRYWERLQGVVPADSPIANAVVAGLAQARQLAGQQPQREAVQAAPEAIRGEIELAPALRDRVAPSDTVYIFARAAEGPPMPLAVLRKQAKDLPLRFQLDDTLAMAPQMKLSGQSNVVVTARVSKSGGQLRRAGTCRAKASPCVRALLA